MKIGEILSFHEHLFSLVATTVYMKFHIGYSLQWYFCCPHSVAIEYSDLNVSVKNIFSGRNLPVNGGSNILYNMGLQSADWRMYYAGSSHICKLCVCYENYIII